MAIDQDFLRNAGNPRFFTKDEVLKKAESFQGHRGLSDGDPSTTARMGQGLWDKAFEQVVEELMGTKAIDDKELLSYLLTHAQSFPQYKSLYGGKLPQAVQDAREFLKKMPFRPEYAMTFNSKAVARLLETSADETDEYQSEEEEQNEEDQDALPEDKTVEDLTAEIDVITLDVPVFIRLLEMAREDIETDAELHDVVTRVIRVSKVTDVINMEHYPLFVVPKSPEQASKPKKMVKAKQGPDVPPDMLMQALSAGLTSTVGPLKLVPTRISGKYETKVFQAQTNKVAPLMSLLKSLDFSVIKLDNQKVFTGTRMETNGKVTYVAYMPLSGMLVVTSNADSLDI